MPTLHDIDALLARYQAMADAARANDWDTLAALEREAAELRAACIARAGSAAADAQERAALAEGMQRILALDAEIRSHAEPFLTAVRKLLSDGVRDRAVRAAYGALEP
ncbi:flagellar protein FliT [Thauera sinica]|uniref:Flagellar protein FliT n=1 Tax=Thauera sinica TaxID=2665146 RepID=A0ABW1ANY7_9RHOO|nr:flagellar protein FliT [Thauera sp. K11]ATE59434.1 flagellar protein FliT [Thauera sp. K11]